MTCRTYDSCRGWRCSIWAPLGCCCWPDMWKGYVDGVAPVSRGEEHSVRDDPEPVRTNRLATRFLATTSLWESGDLRHKTGSWLVLGVFLAGKWRRSHFPIQITSLENCSLLRHYAASSANLLPTFRDNSSITSSGFLNSEDPLWILGPWKWDR